MNKKKILLIWNYFYLESEKGESRFAYLARLLARNGYELEIVTSSFYHMNKIHRNISKEELDSYPYKITFIDEPGYKKNISFKRIKSINVFNKGIKNYLNKLDYRPDLIYVPIPSIKLGHIASKYCTKNNIPLLIDVEDLWPESFTMLTHSKLLTRLLFFPWFISANSLYKKAIVVVAVSQTFLYRAFCVRKDKSLSCVAYIGANFERAASIDPSGITKDDGDIWLSYIGTLGKSYDIKLFIDALDILAENGRTDFVLKIMGDGPDREKIEQYAKNHKGRVEFLGLLPYEQMIKILKNSDYGINPINPRSVASVINKVGDYASVGLPVINTQHCIEYINILRDTNSGVSLLVGNPYEIAGFLYKQGTDDKYIFDTNPIRLFSRKENYEKILKLLKEVIK